MTTQVCVLDDQNKQNLLKRTFAKDLSDDDFLLFLHACKRSGLDPFMKQIYAIPRDDYQSGTKKMTIQTGIDGYRLIADRTGKYMPGRDCTYGYDKDGKLMCATAYVKKLASDGSWHEICHTVYWNEYVALKKDGTPIALWKTKPHIMLGKCAEAGALRKAFPADLSGIYTKEEMEQGDIILLENTKAEQVFLEPTITNEQFMQIIDLIGDAGDNGFAKEEDNVFARNMCSHLNIQSLDKIPQSKFDMALKWATKRKNSKVAQV